MKEWSKITKEELTRLFVDKGMSYKQIASLFNVTRSAVAGKARRLDVHRVTASDIKRAKKILSQTPKTSVPRGPAKKLEIDMPAQEKKKRYRVRYTVADEAATNSKFEAVEVFENQIHKIPGNSRCKWIFGDVKSGNATWCKRPVVVGTAWCKTHKEIVYRPVQERVSLKQRSNQEAGRKAKVWHR